MPRTHRPYAPEFRQQLVELVRSGRTAEELAQEFEPCAGAIRNWVAQQERDADPPSPMRSVTASCTAPTASTWREIRYASCMPSVPTGTQPSGWASVPPGATTAAGWSVAAARGAPGFLLRVRFSNEAAVSAFGPLHGRQALPSGRQRRAARRQSLPLSGSLRAFQTRGCTPGYPRKSEKCPSTASLNAAGPARSAAPASASIAIERARVRSVGCCSEPTSAACHRATGRVRGSSGR